MSTFKFELGVLVKDRVSGFEGVVIARTEWLYNCARYVVQPRSVDKDGKPKGAEVFDEEQLYKAARKPLEIRPGVFAGKKATKVDHGGLMPAPTRRAEPRR
jgi:hypothetical protein